MMCDLGIPNHHQSANPVEKDICNSIVYLLCNTLVLHAK